MDREILRRARIRSGLSLADIAKELGCDQSSIHCYEVAKRQPSPETIRRWTEALHRLLDRRRVTIESALSALGEAATV
ncbi:MAG: helix-turn-helix domain-containing protein [Candidatus Eiseniibacteriota bacterium]